MNGAIKTIVALLLIIVIAVPVIYYYFEEGRAHENKRPIIEIEYPYDGSTVSKIVIISGNTFDKDSDDNLLEVNGSAKETRGISFVQDVIEPFCKVPGAGNDKIKVVFIDESDYLTDTSFHSLRSIVEKYAKYCRFIFTCNYYTKIPEAFVPEVVIILLEKNEFSTKFILIP